VTRRGAGIGRLVRAAIAGSLLLLVVRSTTGCAAAKPDDPPLTEVQRARDGDIEVVVLAPTDALKRTRNYCTLEFRTGADRHLVDVGTVTVRTMMTMDGAPMSGVSTDPKRVSAGRYTVQVVLAMSGNWQIGIDWDGPAGKGSATFSAAVR
jgi:hypothetical protein